MHGIERTPTEILDGIFISTKTSTYSELANRQTGPNTHVPLVGNPKDKLM